MFVRDGRTRKDVLERLVIKEKCQIAVKGLKDTFKIDKLDKIFGSFPQLCRY